MVRGDYDALDEEAQIEALRRVALAATATFGLDVASLETVLHGYNTTFRVDTVQGRRVALRVNTNSKSTVAHVVAQQSWVHAIARDTDVLVPDAVATPEGRTVVAVTCPEASRDLLCVVNTWLEGPDVGECDAVQAAALGRAMATLHDHARSFVGPAAALPVYDEPLLGDENLLEHSPLLDDDGQAVLAEAFARTRAAFAAQPRGARAIALHADLHGGNLKWHDDRLAVFDFDDAGVGAPLFDLAVAAFYLRGSDPTVEDALYAGYAAVAPLPAGWEQLEALVAARQLLLANSLLMSSTASLRDEASGYLDTTVRRLRHWLDAGHFRLDPPGD